MFHTLYFDHVFPSSTSSQFLSTSIPTSRFYFYFSFKNKLKPNKQKYLKTKKMKIKNKQKVNMIEWWKHTHTAIKIENHWVYFVLANFSGSTRHAVECGWYAWWYSIGENWLSLCRQLSVANSFLVRVENLCLPPQLSAGAPSALNLCRSCVCYHSLWAHMCTSPVLSGRHMSHSGS